MMLIMFCFGLGFFFMAEQTPRRSSLQGKMDLFWLPSNGPEVRQNITLVGTFERAVCSPHGSQETVRKQKGPGTSLKVHPSDLLPSAKPYAFILSPLIASSNHESIDEVRGSMI